MKYVVLDSIDLLSYTKPISVYTWSDIRVPIIFPSSFAFAFSPRGLMIIPMNRVGVTSPNSQVSCITIVFCKRIHMITGVETNSTVAARITQDSAPLGTFEIIL